MIFNPQQGHTTSTDKRSANSRRRTGRLEIESVGSSLGPVVNLSSGGVQVLCTRTPRSPTDIRLVGCGTTLNVRGEVAWFRRIGLFRKIVGIHFIDLTPEQISQLTSMAMTNTVRRMIA